MLNVREDVPFCLSVLYEIIANYFVLRLNFHRIEDPTRLFAYQVDLAERASAQQLHRLEMVRCYAAQIIKVACTKRLMSLKATLTSQKHLIRLQVNSDIVLGRMLHQRKHTASLLHIARRFYIAYLLASGFGCPLIGPGWLGELWAHLQLL